MDDFWISFSFIGFTVLSDLASSLECQISGGFALLNAMNPNVQQYFFRISMTFGVFAFYRAIKEMRFQELWMIFGFLLVLLVLLYSLIWHPLQNARFLVVLHYTMQ